MQQAPSSPDRHDYLKHSIGIMHSIIHDRLSQYCVHKCVYQSEVHVPDGINFFRLSHTGHILTIYRHR